MLSPDDIRDIVLAVGTVNGAYTSLEALNTSGAFSVVFRARRITDDTRTILKFFADEKNSAYRKLAFEREGRLLWGPLRGEDQFVQLVAPPDYLTLAAQVGPRKSTLSLPYLAFEYMNGGDAETLAARRVQTIADILARLRCFREMTRSVGRLHHLNCYHRDLKPGNFLFQNLPGEQRVRLSDFGTIRLSDGSPPIMPEYRAPVGDWRYSAPELFSAVDIPPAWNRGADIYSLGAILFELLTTYQLIQTTFGSAARAVLFSQHMAAIPESSRLQKYQGFADSAGFRLPSVRIFNPLIPKCIAPYLDELLSALTEFDYRKRNIEVSRIVRLLDISSLVLKNETRYLERLQRRRAARGTP